MSVREEILQEIKETPPLSQGTRRLLDTFFSEDFTPGKVEDVVAGDPALSSHVLKMANMLSTPGRRRFLTCPRRGA